MIWEDTVNDFVKNSYFESIKNFEQESENNSSESISTKQNTNLNCDITNEINNLDFNFANFIDLEENNEFKTQEKMTQEETIIYSKKEMLETESICKGQNNLKNFPENIFEYDFNKKDIKSKNKSNIENQSVSPKMLEDSMIRHKFKNRLCKNLTLFINRLIKDDDELDIEEIKGMNQHFVDYVQIDFNKEALKESISYLYINDFALLPKNKKDEKNVQANKRKHNIIQINKIKEQSYNSFLKVLFFNTTWAEVIQQYLNSKYYSEHLNEIKLSYLGNEGEIYFQKFKDLSSNFVNYFATESIANKRHKKRNQQLKTTIKL